MSRYFFFQLLFWIPVGLLFYSYIIYPLTLEIIYFFRKKNQPPTSSLQLPTLSILLSVFNEEKVIEEKIKNIFESDYPKDKMEVLVGNDCSSDSTKEILERLKTRNYKLETRNFDARRGKPAVLNDLVKEAKGEIILLTDANILFEKDAIKKLVAHFNESKVGLAGGNIINESSGQGISLQEETYINRENRIKYLEGKCFGTMIGPFGGFYALRKSLFQNVPENFLVDDFFICMNVLKQNFKAIAEPDAIANEDVPEDWRQEFKRKSRISAGNFQNLVHFENLLLRFNATSFCFFSHKVLRWLGPFFILLALLLNILVVFISHHYFYRFIMWLQLLILLLPLYEWLNGKIGRGNFWWKSLSYFYKMNFALLIGWFRYLQGIKSGAWTPTKRN